MRRGRKNGIEVGDDALDIGPTARIEDYALERSVSDEYKTLLRMFKEDARGTTACVAILISPKTLLPVFISHYEHRLYVHDIAFGRVLVEGYYGDEDDNSGHDCLRQHMSPGSRDRSEREGGFGPLAYYGGAIVSAVKGGGCIFSEEGHRSSAASRAWRNFHQQDLARTVDVEGDEPEPETVYETDRVDPDQFLLAYYEAEGWPDGLEISDDPEDATYLAVEVEDAVRVSDLHPYFEESLSEEVRYSDDISYEYTGSSVGYGSRIRIRVTLSLRRGDEGPTINTDGFLEVTGGREEISEPEFFRYDVMTAERVLHRSGCVVWLNDSHLDEGFTPPDPLVLAHMNPKATTAGWFSQIFLACATQQSTVEQAMEYLDLLRQEAIAIKTNLRTPMMTGLFRAIGELLPDVPVKRRAARRNGGKLNIIPKRQWLEQAAELE